MSLLLAAALGALGTGAPGLLAQGPELELVPGERPPALDWAGDVHELRSEILGQELRLFVGKPPTFARSQRSYPVLFLLDGQHYFAEVQSIVAALAASGQIPELLLVGIESLVMYAERSPGGPLEGEIVFRGMRFVPPPGEEVLPAYFELARVDGGQK